MDIITKLLIIGALFASIGFMQRLSAGEVDCIPKPQIEIPVCKDMPLGPRFWGRR